MIPSLTSQVVRDSQNVRFVVLFCALCESRTRSALRRMCERLADFSADSLADCGRSVKAVYALATDRPASRQPDRSRILRQRSEFPPRFITINAQPVSHGIQ